MGHLSVGLASRMWSVTALLLALVTSTHEIRAQQLLEGHSIRSPPDIHALAAQWHLVGTIIPTRRTLMVSPGTTNRGGMLWSRGPVLTNNFEVTLTFSATSPTGYTPMENSGFALWYVQENVTKTHTELPVDFHQSQEELITGTWEKRYENSVLGIDLFGYRSNFNGLGLFFVGGEHPSISLLANDGSKSVKLGEQLPAADALRTSWITGKDFTVVVTIEPNTVKVTLPGGSTSVVHTNVQPGGYLGITCYGGSKDRPDARLAKTPVVELMSLLTLNKDQTQRGEETYVAPTAPPVDPEAEKEDIIRSASSHKDHREESEAIKDLTNMVFKLVVEAQPARLQLTRALETLGNRITAMEHSFAELKLELDKKTGHKLGEEFEALKAELVSLSSVASKEQQERHSVLESLHAEIDHVHKSAQSADSIDKHLDSLSQSHGKVLSQLTTEHQRMFGVSIAAIAFIIIAGLSLYNKFRCWEKKHVL